jgi:hypothetical protein
MEKGAMNGPHVEPKDELRVEAHYGPEYDDSKYRSERKERAEKKQKALKAEIKALTPQKAFDLVKAGLDKELRRCEIESMEYEEPSISEAYDE